MARRRALKKDAADANTWRHGRDRHLGCLSNEFGQTVPLFFTRERAPINIIGHYKGASAFMLCNGPSMRDLDLNLLKQAGVMTYGMNNGPRTFRPDFWTCVDDPSRFMKSIWMDPKITKIVPFATYEKKIFDNQETWQMTNIKVGDCPNVIGYCRNEKFMANRFLLEDCLNWGNHKEYGGGRSVMLPVMRILHLLGFRKVYMLGCDLNMSENSTYHFDEKREKGAVNCNTSTYKRLKDEYFPQLKPYFDEEGFEVFNCNQDSELKIFPYISFEEAVHEATSKVGDVANERTYGMYDKPGEKPKVAVEIPDEEKKNQLRNVETNNRV